MAVALADAGSDDLLNLGGGKRGWSLVNVYGSKKRWRFQGRGMSIVKAGSERRQWKGRLMVRCDNLT
jgi:hypothetical protein